MIWNILRAVRSPIGADRIASYCIVSYRIVSYRIVSYRQKNVVLKPTSYSIRSSKFFLTRRRVVTKPTMPIRLFLNPLKNEVTLKNLVAWREVVGGGGKEGHERASYIHFELYIVHIA